MINKLKQINEKRQKQREESEKNYLDHEEMKCRIGKKKWKLTIKMLQPKARGRH